MKFLQFFHRDGGNASSLLHRAILHQNMRRRNNEKRDELTLFSEELVYAYPATAIDVLGYHAKFMIGIGLGWHYLLDLIWTLEKLRPFGQRLRILDAGGSLGLLQFILASQGHAVVSVDAFYRDVPKQCDNIIPVRLSGSSSSLETDYVKRVPENYRTEATLPPRSEVGGGGIEFHCADLGYMPSVKTNEFDAVVSISALEHNSRESLVPILKEIRRVAKPDAPLVFTLSTSINGIAFHEPSHSYCYDEEELKEIYGLSQHTLSNFSQKEEYQEMLTASKFCKKYLSSFYFQNDKSGMPNGVWIPQYLPFGLFCINRK